MALIGINPGTPRQRKRSILEEIESGVNIAAKVIGGGLDTYKTFALERPKLMAETAYTEAQTEKVKNELSEDDKIILESYKGNGYVLGHKDAPGSVPVYLRGRDQTFFATPGESKKGKAFELSDKLRSEYLDPETKEFKVVQSAANAISDAFKEGDFERDDAGRDIRLLRQTISALDPGANFRPNDVELSKEASPLTQQAVELFRKATSDQSKTSLLPPALRRDFAFAALDAYDSSKRAQEEKIKWFQTKAMDRGVDWRDVIEPFIPLNDKKLRELRDAMRGGQRKSKNEFDNAAKQLELGR